MANQPERQIIGKMRVEHVVYLALMYELMEERFGDNFTKMCSAVQEEMILLCNSVPMDVAIECVNKKFEHPEYSIKRNLIEAVILPDKKLMS